MGVLQRVIYILAFASIAFTATEVYLTLNKLWKRKHEVEVAESISVTAMLISLIPGILFSLNYLIERQWQGLIDQLLYMYLVICQIFIGIKFWVQGERKKGLLKLFKQSLNLERQEAGDLAKSFFKPSGANKIIDILVQIALIDEVIEAREKEFIQSFVDNWNIKFSWEEVTENSNASSDVNFIKLRKDVADYLANSPPNNQVSQLSDVINNLIKIDDEVSESEKLIAAELNGMFNRYLGNYLENHIYHVVVVPRNDKQEQAIITSFPSLSKYWIGDGFSYHDGPFYSDKYAKIVKEQYKTLNLTTYVTLLE